jgi:CutA1 divalent ion tolerance protein
MDALVKNVGIQMVATLNDTGPIVVLITVPNGDVARVIAMALVEERLAACVSEFMSFRR